MLHLLAALALAVVPVTPPAPEEVIAIVGANVIPMTRETVLSDRTVIIRDGRIVRIGPRASSAIPKNARRIPANGKYLIPGFADMHAHLLSDGNVPDSIAPDELNVMLANGVTTARLMIGTPEQLALRERVRRGEIRGPRLHIASPELAGRAYGDPFNGYVVATPEQAREAVRRAKRDGYDYIKVTILISREVYDAIVETAREVDIRVVGHVEPTVGLPAAIAAHQQIEHLDNHLEQLLPDTFKLRRAVTGTGVWNPKMWPLVDLMDATKIDSVAAQIAAAGIYSTPTLAFFKLAFVNPQTNDDIDARPDSRFFPESVRREHLEARDEWLRRLPSEARRAQYMRLKNRFVKALHEHGAPLMTGSDSPEWPLLMSGFMVHEELKALVEAGLSPYEALRTATVVPAQWLNESDAGTVTEGARADLVLLDANPLAQIGSTRHIAGVFVNGAFLPKDTLATLLERASARIRGSESPRRVSVIDSLAGPESMQWDRDLDVYFISEIGAHPTRTENHGRILKVTPDGKVDREFIRGGVAGNTLHAPKGLAISGDTLWVADVDAIRAFDKRSGATLATIDMTPQKAVFLNDVSPAPDGGVYATDTGLVFDANGVSHQPSDRIFHVRADGSVRVVLSGDSLAGPNGVLWNTRTNELQIVSIWGPDAKVLSWRPGQSDAHVVTRTAGGFDGIVQLPDGRVLVSNNDTGDIAELRAGRLEVLIPGASNNLRSAADLGYDAKRNRLLIPLVSSRRVEIWQLN